ncbi:N-acyl-D-amino-acid deacylase family protein [Pacificimonas sp. ICDLI1SI03]
MANSFLKVASAAMAIGMSTLAMAADYDVIIRGGTVLDGTGTEGRRADVGITGDRIMAIGDLSAATAATERDASGLYVTPGFVSVHDHSVRESYAVPVNLLVQGITTAIVNPDGGGPLDFSRQIRTPSGINYGAYLGFNSVWQETVGMDDRRATPEEIEQMKTLVEEGMRAGAFGLSAGLDYKPGFWASTEEVAAVTGAAAPWRTQFTNHERVYPGNGYSSMAGMEETVEIGETAGVMPVITHMKLQGGDQGKSDAALALATDGAKRGLTVGMDAYPYTFGSTSLHQLTIPAWAQEGGEEAMLARFKDPELRARIDAETNEQLETRWGGPGGVYLAARQQELTDAIEEMGGVSPGEAIMRLLEAGERRVLLRFGTEADQEAIVSHPLTAVSCDCGASGALTGHPRQWGAFPRFLGRYVREKQLVSWPEAVRKMTALPATMIGLTERGYLLPGMIADVVLFDPETIIDGSTTAEPVKPPQGIEAVLVNGAIALDGEMVSAAPRGKALFRSPHEPARAMNFDVTRSLTATGATVDNGMTVDIRVAQDAGAAAPTGTVQIDGLAEGTLTLVPSILQTTENWGSITGVGTWSDDRQAAVTVIVEQRDPFAGDQPSVTVLVNGEERGAGSLPAGSVEVREQAG